MAYFCHLDSANRIDGTNLQLYSLEKAAEEWNTLLGFVNEPDYFNTNSMAERIAFIISCLGLSLSQLIGQNSPSGNGKRIPSPSILLPNLLEEITDDETLERLIGMFNDFLVYYNAIRHFGNVKHAVVEELTLEKLDYFRIMTIEIWDIIISKYRQDNESELEGFSSIREIVHFKNID
jgi:hypothetical protein